MTTGFESLRGKHAGSWALVIGQGPSKSETPALTGCVELVTNDGSSHRPDAEYAVILDRPRQLLRNKRVGQIVRARSKTLIYDNNFRIWKSWAEEYGDAHAKKWIEEVIPFQARRRLPRSRRFPNGDPLDDWREGIIPYFLGTPFACCSIAAWLGATRVGVLGVDMDDPERWSEDVRDESRQQYRRLWSLLGSTGVELVSLSAKNVFHEVIPHESVGTFAGGP